LLGYVNNKTQQTTGIRIPGGLSFLLHGDFKAPIKGLNAFPENERPKQVNAIFQFYHIMVGIGVSLIGLSVFGTWLYYRNKLFDKRWLLWIFVWAVLLPQIARCFVESSDRQPGTFFSYHVHGSVPVAADTFSLPA
jgi:cytochrome bd ubiquinol oxidase subunit I